MYLTYSILYLIVLFFLLPFEFLKRPKKLRIRWLKERLGFYSELQTPNSELIIWIHAVSVGEVIAAVPLIKKIKERYPSSEVIISTVTDTGQKVAHERTSSIAKIIYMPFDLPFAIKNAVASVSPSLFIIMETELWPNIIRLLKRKGVPVLLMNGRISGKSFGGYKRLRFFIKDVLKNIDALCMQNELYAERIRELGAKPERVKAIGSFKFDTKPFSAIPEWTKVFRRQKTEDRGQTKEKEFTIVAGSTHRTEEGLILDSYIKLREDFPELNLIIAPRHPERFREVEELIKKRGVEYIKRSNVTSHGLVVTGVVVLLDVIGELASVYGACDIAIIGGSFIKHGGQNPLEPAYWGKAIVCGPHMENFPFIDDFYRGGGALKTDAADLASTLAGLLSSPEKQEEMGRSARKLYEKNSGAVERAMEIIDSIIRAQKTGDRKQTKDIETNSLLITHYSLLEKLYYIGYSLDKRFKLKRQKRLPYPVISIGNITVGGTGKTPATIAIAEEAKKRGFQPIILTRGYMGKAKGPCLVQKSEAYPRMPLSGVRSQKSEAKEKATDLYGDEPVLMAERLKNVPIVKCADRYKGGIFAVNELNLQSSPFSLLPVFILDDGFQHWRLCRDVDIVLIDGLNPFGNKRLLPMGLLREPIKELKRADIFIITKTPATEKGILKELKNIHSDAPIYLSEYRMLKIKDANGRDLSAEELKGKKVFAFCGIANPESFKQNVLSINVNLCGFKAYQDHYRYSESDMNYIAKQGKVSCCDFLITTEKDIVKLRELKIMDNLLYIEIGFEINNFFFEYLFKKIKQLPPKR